VPWCDHPACPPSGTVLCDVSDVPDEGGREIVFGTDREPLRILLLRQGAAVWGYENNCPHFSLPLNFDPQVFVTLDGMVMCAHHTAFFKFEDGSCVDGPCAGAGLTPIAVQCRDGQVVLEGVAGGSAPVESSE
jgi:nitrite reductase/ring-hydroxylating ferredoxin subunit